MPLKLNICYKTSLIKHITIKSVLALMVLIFPYYAKYFFFSSDFWASMYIFTALRTDFIPKSAGLTSRIGKKKHSSTSSLAWIWALSSSFASKKTSIVGTINPEYKYSFGKVKRKFIDIGFTPISSVISRIAHCSIVSSRSANPPGRSSVPFSGSCAQRQTSNSPLEFRIKLAVAAEGFM